MVRKDYLLAGLAAAGLTASIFEIQRLRNELHEHKVSNPSGPNEPARSALLAAVELGGTTVRCAVAYFDQPTNLIDACEIPTQDPKTTLADIRRFLDQFAPFVSLGVASFGPVDLDPRSPTYGYILNTPKVNWKNFGLLKQLCASYPVPTKFDTDVNAPALAELRVGDHGADVRSVAYITVGTGIGVGLVVNGSAVHGLVHPEGGHVLVAGKPGDRTVVSGRTCVEDVACAGAIAERVGCSPDKLPQVKDEHPVWESVCTHFLFAFGFELLTHSLSMKVSYYLAQLCLSITYMVSPHVIVISGGVMNRKSLYPRIRKHFSVLNAGYITHRRVTTEIDRYIVPSKFGNSGIIGALELARLAAIEPR